MRLTVKNLIYQYWDGNLTSGCKAGSENMKRYATRIGAEYLFEHNPRFVTNLGGYSAHFGSFKPIYDETFHIYDNVLFTDTDVFVVDGIKENIFENFNVDLGICTEPFQPKQRERVPGLLSKASDEHWASIIKSKWSIDLPRTSEGLLKVYNSGVVLYSNKGLLAAREKFVPFIEYINLVKSKKAKSFYTSDQSYLHAMLFVARMNYIELNNEWNRFIHYYHTDVSKKSVSINDSRTSDTKFVHIQLRGADNYDAPTLWRITNLPREEWKIQHGHPCKLV